jgi:hypothetical protein
MMRSKARGNFPEFHKQVKFDRMLTELAIKYWLVPPFVRHLRPARRGSESRVCLWFGNDMVI